MKQKETYEALFKHAGHKLEIRAYTSRNRPPGFVEIHCIDCDKPIVSRKYKGGHDVTTRRTNTGNA
jgi:hypothetical protein